MRECVKPGCGRPAEVSAGVRYAERVAWLGDLVPERDPNLLDLCTEHADRLRPPRGWRVVDDRSPASDVSLEPVQEVVAGG
ncbi:MAG: DUF3499 family protein [Actinomycetota bacterium]